MAHMAKHGIASLCSTFSVYLWLLGIVAPQRSRTPEQAALPARWDGAKCGDEDQKTGQGIGCD